MGPLRNCSFDLCNTWCQSLFHDFKSSVCSADIETHGDGSAELLYEASTRQQVTGTPIADVWDEGKKRRGITVQGASGFAQPSIKQRACGGGKTAPWILWNPRDGHENKRSELLTQHLQVGRQPRGWCRRGDDCGVQRRSWSGAAVLLHNTALQPAGASRYLTRTFQRVGKRHPCPFSAKKNKKNPS